MESSRAHTAIRYVGYTPLSINMICLLFPSHPSSLRFCQLWPLMCSVYCLCEKQLPRDPSPFFPQLSSSSSSSHCQQVSCYSLWTQQFSKQCKCSIHHWHFCGISAGSVKGGGGGAGWLAVRKLTSVISSTHQRMLTPASTVKWAVLKRCQPHGVSLLF